jgi:3-oxoacyl-[acyl-carrier-protein] synthase II
MRDVLGDVAVPVIATKSNFGNLGAASGATELAASLLALVEGRLPRMINYETPDPQCPIAAVTTDDQPPGDCFVNLNITPQAQASAVLVQRYK